MMMMMMMMMMMTLPARLEWTDTACCASSYWECSSIFPPPVKHINCWWQCAANYWSNSPWTGITEVAARKSYMMLTAVYIKVCSHWMQCCGAAWHVRSLSPQLDAILVCSNKPSDEKPVSLVATIPILMRCMSELQPTMCLCVISLYILTSLVSRVKFNGNVCRRLLWHSLVDNCGFLVANLLVQRSHSFTITKISGCWIWRTLFGRKSRKSLFVDWMHVYVYFVFWELSSFRLNWRNWCLWY